MRGSCEFEYVYGYPPLVTDSEFSEYFKGIAAQIVGEENVVEIEEPTMGGEDMAFFLKAAPGTFFFLGSAKAGEDVYPHHHPKFDLDEKVMWKGTALFVATAYSWLKDNA